MPKRYRQKSKKPARMQARDKWMKKNRVILGKAYPDEWRKRTQAAPAASRIRIVDRRSLFASFGVEFPDLDVA